MSFLRLSYVLAKLSNLVYTTTAANLGQSTRIDVPLRGPTQRMASASATLIFIRCF